MNYNSIRTPYYYVDESLLIKNLELLKYVQDKTDCKILLAQKGFSMYSVYPLIGQYLAGTTASSLNEAKLGYQEMGKETHIYAPAYREDEIEEILSICDHIVFNSYNQYLKFKDSVASQGRKIEVGLRINPEYSEITTDIYNPCHGLSRLGIRRADLSKEMLQGIDGLHFHTMCEQNSDTLERTIDKVIEKFADLLPYIKWLNMGGGHHITRSDYDVDRLIKVINRVKKDYNLEIYLEPGEAIALNTGFLVSKVLDIINNPAMDIAILDTSAACHMPDVLEMPYRPNIIGAGKPNEKQFTYKLGAPTCLAGDVIGDYSFDKPLEIGDLIIFLDMAHYTMVKNNTFNGVNLPSIALLTKENELKLIKEFNYNDFKTRLS